MPSAASWRAAIARPAFGALLIGTLITIAATGRVTMIDVLLATVSWSFVPATQLLVGAAVIASVPRRSVVAAADRAVLCRPCDVVALAVGRGPKVYWTI